MVVSDDEEFGGPARPEDGAAIIPFRRIKPDPQIAESWARERATLNGKKQTSFALRSTLDGVDELERKRKLPVLPLPAAWHDFARRIRHYAGEMLAISGPSGGGKTSFAIELCRAAIGSGVPVLWLPKELDEPQVNMRVCANVTHTHVLTIFDTWTGDDIRRVLTASVGDRWHFVDNYRDTDKQFEAIAAGIELCKRVYGRPPLFVCDYLGKHASTDDPRKELRIIVERYRDLFATTDTFGCLLSQTSRGNNTMLSGKVEIENASDAIGVSAETAELEHAAANNIALNVFKRDDADVLDVHVLATKARGTGREGRTGFQFHKAGGSWREIDIIPATPAEIASEQARQAKDKSRIAPVADVPSVRKDLNAAKSEAANQRREQVILGHVRRAGFDGIAEKNLRTLPGCGAWARFKASLDALARRGDIEQRNHRWRVKTQLEI